MPVNIPDPEYKPLRYFSENEANEKISKPSISLLQECRINAKTKRPFKRFDLNKFKVFISNKFYVFVYIPISKINPLLFRITSRQKSKLRNRKFT